METFGYALVFFAIYFIPSFLAHQRKHRSASAIVIFNLFLGWTGIGWVVALIWANTGNTEPTGPTPDTHVRCPECAELVRREAKVCKHCGTRLIPQ